jgi:hypothetical protein
MWARLNYQLLLGPSYFGNNPHPSALTLHIQNKGVGHTVAAPFTIKSILRQKKKNYGNSNISPCKNILFKKSS